MADPISLNLVTLAGVVDGIPASKMSSDGQQSLTEMVVLTSMDGRVIRHRIRVVDPDLAKAALQGGGRPVTIVGELDYDAVGAFVAVLARRACDLRFSDAVVVVSAPADTTQRAQEQANVVDAPVEEPPAPVVLESESVQEPEVQEPPVAESAPNPPTVRQPSSFTRGPGFGGRLGGLKSTTTPEAAPPAESVDPVPAQQPKPSGGFSRFGKPTGSGLPASSPPAPASAAGSAMVGADRFDDDIPFAPEWRG